MILADIGKWNHKPRRLRRAYTGGGGEREQLLGGIFLANGFRGGRNMIKREEKFREFQNVWPIRSPPPKKIYIYIQGVPKKRNDNFWTIKRSNVDGF